MNLVRAILCRLSVHHWTLWATDRPATILLHYVCSRCGARRRA